MTQYKDVWGPAVWASEDLQTPWHNLAPVIDPQKANETMWGLAVGYAVEVAENIQDIPNWRKAAYQVWQEGAKGAAFHGRAAAHYALMAEESLEYDGAEYLQSLAAAVRPFGGGAVLAKTLEACVVGAPVLERYMGQPYNPSVLAEPTEGFVKAFSELLRLWASAWQKPCAKVKGASDLQQLVNYLVVLSAEDIAQLEPAYFEELVELHSALFLRLLKGGEHHLLAQPLTKKVAEVVGVLNVAAEAPLFNALGLEAACDPLGLKQSSTLKQVAAEGVYLPNMPLFLAGEPIGAEHRKALAVARQKSGLEGRLAEVLNSETFQKLPRQIGDLKVSSMNRTAVLQHVVSSIPTYF